MDYLNDTEFPALPDVENGLALLLHLNHHLEEGMGLRHIVDWLMFASVKLDDKLWNDTFEAVVSEIGLRTLAITVTRMGQLFLGVPIDNMEWCKEANNQTCADLLDYIFQNGDYGLKDIGCTKTANTILEIKKNGFIRNLQDKGLHNWKACQTKTCLQPLAWMYQIVWLAKKSLSYGNPIKTYFKGKCKAKQRLQLLSEIGADHWIDGN